MNTIVSVESFYFLGSLPIEELLTLGMKSIQVSFNQCATSYMCFTPSVNNLYFTVMWIVTRKGEIMLSVPPNCFSIFE